jgi:hypothetical protein
MVVLRLLLPICLRTGKYVHVFDPFTKFHY